MLAIFSAVSLLACNCAIGRDMVRCDYYVVKEHDLSHQKDCVKYADSINKNSMYAKASWYYLLGGDMKKAKENAKEALKIGHHFAGEYLGFVYLIEKNSKEAKKYLNDFKQKVKNIDYVKKDIKTLKNIYKGFEATKAYNILYGK